MKMKNKKPLSEPAKYTAIEIGKAVSSNFQKWAWRTKNPTV